jgi:hypothetical protein
LSNYNTVFEKSKIFCGVTWNHKYLHTRAAADNFKFRENNMNDIVQQLINFIFTDPTKIGMVGLMMLITIGALWMMDRRDREHKADIKEMIEQSQKHNDENRKDLMEIIEKYQEGQISVIQAINEIKILLATIGAKL